MAFGGSPAIASSNGRFGNILTTLTISRLHQDLLISAERSEIEIADHVDAMLGNRLAPELFAHPTALTSLDHRRLVAALHAGDVLAHGAEEQLGVLREVAGIAPELLEVPVGESGRRGAPRRRRPRHAHQQRTGCSCRWPRADDSRWPRPASPGTRHGEHRAAARQGVGDRVHRDDAGRRGRARTPAFLRRRSQARLQPVEGRRATEVAPAAHGHLH